MRRLVAACALVALAACAHRAPEPAPTPKGGPVGFVRMDELVKHHPLFPQLDRYDRDITALDLTATAPAAVAAQPDVARRTAELQRELHDAADRTQRLLGEKQKQYEAQEQAAIRAALGAAGGPSGPGAAGIAGGVNAAANAQAADAAKRAQRDFDAYRSEIVKREDEELAATQRTLTERANRDLAARAEEAQRREAALSLKLANDDAAQRLSLRTKLASLALDDAARADAQKQLDALDRSEADQVGALRNRDQAELARQRAELGGSLKGDVQKRADAIRERDRRLLADREKQLRAGIVAQAGPVLAAPSGRPAAVPADVQARIKTLHDDYARRFQADAKKTIADFTARRAELQKRYDELRGVGDAAQGDAQRQAADLRAKRRELYGQIVAQIGREVQVVARERGVRVVLSDIAAPAPGAVDLTGDALKDLESLHE